MRNFSYLRVTSPQEASHALAVGEGKIRVIAGGTDIIPLAKDGITSPDGLVDITGWFAGSGIEQTHSSLVMGALTSLSDIESHATIRAEYSALAEACHVAATPQLRNMGTIAGNILQQTRCWYYRGPFDCWLKGGEKCFARTGENENHSIFATSTSPCVSAHPSDPAAALLVLDARVRFITSDSEGESEIPLEQLYAVPEETRRSFVRLPDDAVITAIVLPRPETQTSSTYVKAMARASWGFALAGVAIALSGAEAITKARVALSGVAPVPMRAYAIETAIEGKPPSQLDGQSLAEMLVAKAEPLSHNRYKVALLRGIFSEALEAVCKIS